MNSKGSLHASYSAAKCQTIGISPDQPPKRWYGFSPRLPSQLRALEKLKHWVVWRWEKRDDGWTKPPYRATPYPTTDEPFYRWHSLGLLGHAKTDDPATWSSYADAMRIADRGRHHYDRGFCLLGSDICAMDLDHCVEPGNGSRASVTAPWAQELVDEAYKLGAYVETTVSGTGLRIIGHGGRKRVLRIINLPHHGPGTKIEFYRNCEKYITISGARKPTKNPDKLPDIDAFFEATLARFDNKPAGKVDNVILELPNNVVDLDGNAYTAYSNRLDWDHELRELVERGVPKPHRSDKFHYVVCELLEHDWSREEILALLRQHPHGIAEKYRPRLPWAVNYSFERWSREQAAAAEQQQQEQEQAKPKPAPSSLDEVHAVCRKWFGDEYDLDVMDAALAAGASERLGGDPLWLLIVSGPGAAKTETAQSLAGANAHIISTIASEGALLSASPKRGRAKTATGGLLRKIGDRGILVIKDFTSILAADRNMRGSVLAALREVYDGRWVRNVGTDGGQTLEWKGRVVIVGAVTTAWDSAHAVVAAMGDRFVTIRIDSNIGRKQSGMRSIRNTGNEAEMRAELAAVVGGIIGHACTDEVGIDESEIEELVKAADIVTVARTAVERDFQGEVIYAHMPEMPTRFAKQLAQIVRGGVAIGMPRKRAMQLAIRCARDFIPPMRLEILLDITGTPVRAQWMSASASSSRGPQPSASWTP